MVSHALTLAFVVLLLTAAGGQAQGEPGIFLDVLACQTIEVPSRADVVQFERELFPASSSTGLLEADSAQLLYVERGSLSVYLDQTGKGLAGVDSSFFVRPLTPLAVGNDDVSEASLLWLRLSEPSSAAGYLAPALPRALQEIAADEPPASEPLFIEFPLMGTIPNEQATLFIARLVVAPFEVIETVEQIGSDLASSGTVAIVIESGELQVDDGMGRVDVAARQFAAIDGSRGLSLKNAGDEPAEGFLVGLVAPDDTGQIGVGIQDKFGSDGCFST